MADSKLPLNNLAPVRKRLPTLAEVKSNVDEGLDRFRISRFSRLKKDRINSVFADGMPCQRSAVPETINCHSADASMAEVDDRR
jgi:hypothetical protein